MEIISTSYPHLFVKKISAQQVTELAMSYDLQSACFIKIENATFQLNPYIGTHLFEDTPLMQDGIPFSIADNSIKEQLKTIIKSNRLSEKEIKTFILLKLPQFERLLTLWDENAFSKFALTAVGIAIGRAYLEQRKLGDYDINMWIN